MSQIIEIKVPDIGEFKDVEVIEVLVKPGDAVKVEQSLITVESDKASMEIPSSHAGTVKEMRLKLGDKVSEGSVILALDADAAAAAAAPAPAAAAAAPAAAAPAPVPAPAPPAATFSGSADLECDVLVLGAGPGGYSAAFRAADLGRRVRRVPERRLHSFQGAAARGGGDGRGSTFRRYRRQLRQAERRPGQAAHAQGQGGRQAHRRAGRDGSPAGWPRWPRCAR